MSITKFESGEFVPADLNELVTQALAQVELGETPLTGTLLSTAAQLGVSWQVLLGQEGRLGRLLVRNPETPFEQLNLFIFLNAFPDIADLCKVKLDFRSELSEGGNLVRRLLDLSLSAEGIDESRKAALNQYVCANVSDVEQELEDKEAFVDSLELNTNAVECLLKQARIDLNDSTLQLSELFPRQFSSCTPESLHDRYWQLMSMNHELMNLNIAYSLLDAEAWPGFQFHPTVSRIRKAAKALIEDYEATPIPDEFYKAAWIPCVLVLKGLLDACDNPLPLKRLDHQLKLGAQKQCYDN